MKYSGCIFRLTFGNGQPLLPNHYCPTTTCPLDLALYGVPQDSNNHGQSKYRLQNLCNRVLDLKRPFTCPGTALLHNAPGCKHKFWDRHLPGVIIMVELLNKQHFRGIPHWLEVTLSSAWPAWCGRLLCGFRVCYFSCAACAEADSLSTEPAPIKAMYLVVRFNCSLPSARSTYGYFS